MKTFEDLLLENQENELLRFATAGSVDDGKSTLIGRLLFDSKSIFEDQIQSIQKYSSAARTHEFDYALVTDGLKSEREQGITIDVAYRYFSTPRRRFIIADTPGHEQYTRNMATGASTASLALILVDALNGVVTQTRRHSFISSLLGIKHLVVAVNKMDLVDFSEDRFHEIVKQYREFSEKLPLESIHFIPISALFGDNVIEVSDRMPWYKGGPLLDYLESVTVSGGKNLIDFRFPVQYVNWSGAAFRGYCGTIASGIIRVGDSVKILPSNKISTIQEIITPEGNRPYAFALQAVTLTLTDDIDISRGDMIVREKNVPVQARRIEANVVWMDTDNPLQPGKQYLIKHTSHMVRGVVSTIQYRFDPDDLHRKEADTLRLNEIGRVTFDLLNPIFADPYEQNRQTGSFIVIDPVTNLTAGAGMITRCRSQQQTRRTQEIQTWWTPDKNQAEVEYLSQKKAGILSIYLDEEALGEICGERDKTFLSRVSALCQKMNEGGISVVLTLDEKPEIASVDSSERTPE